MRLEDFQYDLPAAAIAQSPLEPRDASRLLDTTTMLDHRFAELPGLLEPGDLVVVNTTKVRRARLVGHRHPTNGRVELLILGALPDGSWDALVKPARKISAGSRLVFENLECVVESEPEGGRVIVRFDGEGDIESRFEATGQVPLPPYITTALDRPERYQTIFANRVGSAAAPTAGLHFTEAVFADLAQKDIAVASVELEVGLGTFRPITSQDVTHHIMHPERYVVPEIAAEAIAAARARGGRVVAVGTTVVRTLESAATASRQVEPGAGETNLYLLPGASFNVVDRLVTNFHMPGSSLLVLLAAFMGPGWRDVYATALERKYRFLSFGDAMVCDRL
jgi:S-adenosylmethionine:tRNA ribosyltransferase-isomerase